MSIAGNNLGMMAGMMKPCARMVRSGRRDGQGGSDEAFAPGDRFPAMITKDRSAEAKMGEALGKRDVYRVVVGRDVVLRKDDILRRDCDGLTVRMTEDTVGSEAPDISTAKIAVARAEGWEIP